MFSLILARIPKSALAPSLLALLVLGTSLGLIQPACALGTATSYTGQLLSGSTALSGHYDFQFTLYNASTGGSIVGSTITKSNVTVANGVFYVELDFGNVFTGSTLYLQTAYRVHPTSGNPAYTTQSPRKLYSSSANADYAAVSGSTKALQGFFVSALAPTNGQVLTWNTGGNKWLAQTLPAPPTYTAGTGLTLSSNQFSVASGGITNSLLANGSVSGAKLALPLTASVSSSSDLFTQTNTGSGRAIVGNSTTNTAVKGVGHNGVYGQGTNYGVQASGTNYGVYSTSPAIGVYGTGATYGVQAVSAGTGILGTGTGTSSIGVRGTGGSSGYGLFGTSGYLGVYGSGTSYGVYGTSST